MEGSSRTTRASKAAKTDGKSSAGGGSGSPPKKGGKKGGVKASLPASAFKSKALPLHINVTHTPPTIPDDETVPAATADPGFLGAVTLVPSSFATGSYGWKGSKRIAVELENGDGQEKVQVMLTINATVLGSKSAPGDDEEANGDEEKEEAAEEKDE
ncbi:hypothetical protein V5O48_012845 [Marasmius crinis-equi]|uniref:Uncharacterized protein n=1 Tax=Marasmius crinis-equi TaxID=585013 RepID=A0ABR3F1R0_9AGAR